MLKLFNPKAGPVPNGPYSHGVLVPANARWLWVAGQTGTRKDGSIPSSVEEQTEVVWQNLLAVLAEGGMGVGDIVKATSFLTRAEDYPKFAPIRARFLGSHRPASTLLVVSALARPEFLVEVEVVAAKAPSAAKPKRPAKKAKKRSR
jgi:2-iminobutanoate/2-iminopropanoate deaminase